jgi:hypothetical protein
MTRIILVLFLVLPFAAVAADQKEEEAKKGAPESISGFYAGDANVAEAQKFLGEGKNAEAISLLEKSLQTNMRNTDVHMMLATAWYNLGRDDKAKEYLTNTLAVDKGHRGAYVMMGYIALRDDNDIRQAKSYLSALKVVCGGDQCAEYNTLNNAITEAEGKQ